MTALFLSHASSDDPLARALEAWLRARGFVDVDIAYEREDEARIDALRATKADGRIVLCLVTDAWLNSASCFHEFLVATSAGLRVLPLYAVGDGERDQRAQERLERVQAEAEGTDLFGLIDGEGAMDPDQESSEAERIRAAVALAGVDPMAFDVDRGSPNAPYPGLFAFGEDDSSAALFFGRDREIQAVLQALRASRSNDDRTAMAVLGAPGVGKSSLLAAGVLPRLRRESKGWLVLPVLRPGSDPLAAFSSIVAAALARYGVEEQPDLLKADLLAAWADAPRDDHGLTPGGRDAIASRLVAEARRLREAAGHPDATLLITIDQAEDIARASGDGADAFGDYLRASMVPEANVRLLLAARIGHFGELQRHHRFESIEANIFDLRGVPVDRWGPIIEMPARRCGLEIDDSLVDAIKSDAPAQDGLAPLAFCLQRLWWKFSAEGSITVDDYRATGALPGLIETVADRALFGPHTGEQRDPSLEAVGARTFVPALVDVTESGESRVRTASWSKFSDAQRAVLDRFVSARLVHRRDDQVEIVHEVVVGHWLRIQGWMEAERERRVALRGLQAAAWAWSDTGQDEQIAHRGPSLRSAEALRDNPRFGESFTAVERAYLDACAELERPDPPPPTNYRRLTAVFVLALILAGGAAAVFGDPWTRQWWASMSWPDIKLSGKPFASLAKNSLGSPSPYVTSEMRPFVLGEGEEAGLVPGDRFRECKKDCPQMVVVPPGGFEMGDDRGEWAFAQPVHVVEIEKFAVSATEVTFAEWSACAADGACRAVSDAGWGEGRRPVINVSLSDAEAYIAWLGHGTGRPYRLLTEAEWEYVARASTDGAFWWGDSVGLGRANCRDCGTEFDGVRTATVASFAANGFGLYDVHGNVWEWVQDCWHPDYVSAPGDGAAWKLDDNGDCGKAVIRGGSWEASSNVIRAASRDWYPRGDSSTGIGFRVARALAR